MENVGQSPSVVLFDFDDTLSDHPVFSRRFISSMALAMWMFHGGQVERWAWSVRAMMMRLEEAYIARFCPPTGTQPLGYREWLQEARGMAVQWLYGGVGLEAPLNAQRRAQKAQKVALRRSVALFPGARDVIMGLHLRGFQLAIASGNDSQTLHHALVGCGLRAYFKKLYGADVVDCAKEGPDFYKAILDDLDVAPQSALVVDNDPVAIQWAYAVGIRAIQLRYHNEPVTHRAAAVIEDIRELLTLSLVG